MKHYRKLAGNIKPNPGPVKFPCGQCFKPVKSNQKAILCDQCDSWYQLRCPPDMDDEEYYRLSNCQDESEWFCNTCILPNFTDSFFSNRDLTNHSILDSDQSVLELSYSHIDNQDKQNSINCESNLKDVRNQNKTNSHTW